MKKAFMLVAAIALLAAPVFAEVAVTISGDATTTIGYNIDTQDGGIASDMTANIEVVVGTMDGESAGEGNWYGVIELTGAGLTWNSDPQDGELGFATYEWDDDNSVWVSTGDYMQASLVVPDVAAKITNGNIYVQLQSYDNFDADFVATIEPDGFTEVTDYSYTDPGVAGSIMVGGTFAPVTFSFEFGTEGSIDAPGAGVELGAAVTVDMAPLTIDVAYAGGVNYVVTADQAFAIQVAADLAPLSVTAAFDGLYNSTFMYETSLNVALDLDPITVALDGYFRDDKWLDAKATVGFANDMFTADASFLLYNAINNLGYEGAIDVTVTPVSGIMLEAGFSMNSDAVYTAYADVVFTELIDNVTFTAGWENADDLTNNVLGDIFFSTMIEY